MERPGLIAVIRRANANQNIARPSFRIFYSDLKETALERIRVPKFNFAIMSRERVTRSEQLLIRKTGLWIAIHHLHETVRRRAVGIEINLLHILAVIALRTGETEEAFLQNRIVLIPEGERETKPLFVIANAAYAVFAPTIGS